MKAAVQMTPTPTKITPSETCYEPKPNTGSLSGPFAGLQQ